MKVLPITKQIIMMMVSLVLICLGVGIFLVDNKKTFIFGILYGAIFSALKVILLEKTLNKAVDMSAQKATNYIRIHYVLRYFLTFAILGIAVYRSDIMDIYGVIIGFLVLRPAIYLVNSKNNRLEKRLQYEKNQKK